MSLNSDSSVFSGAGDSTSNVDLFSEESEEKRDEVKEVQKRSRTDTKWVKVWRLATNLVLLLTALAISISTYNFLKAEEENNFKTAVS